MDSKHFSYKIPWISLENEWIQSISPTTSKSHESHSKSHESYVLLSLLIIWGWKPSHVSRPSGGGFNTNLALCIYIYLYMCIHIYIYIINMYIVHMIYRGFLKWGIPKSPWPWASILSHGLTTWIWGYQHDLGNHHISWVIWQRQDDFCGDSSESTVTVVGRRW